MPTTRLTLEKTVSSAGVQRDLLHAEDCSQNGVVGAGESNACVAFYKCESNASCTRANPTCTEWCIRARVRRACINACICTDSVHARASRSNANPVRAPGISAGSEEIFLG